MAGDFVADQVHAHVLAPARVVCLKAAWPPGWIPFALPGWASPDPPPGGNPGTPRVMVRRLPRASDESFVWGMVAAYGDVYEFSVTLSGAEPLRTSDIENFKTALRTVPKTIRPKFREVPQDLGAWCGAPHPGGQYWGPSSVRRGVLSWVPIV